MIPKYIDGFDEKPKTWQKPSGSHPWRQYANRTVDNDKKTNIKTIKVFIQEIAENWDSNSVVTSEDGDSGVFKLGSLTQEKQAAWLIGVLKRNYAKQY